MGPDRPKANPSFRYWSRASGLQVTEDQPQVGFRKRIYWLELEVQEQPWLQVWMERGA